MRNAVHHISASPYTDTMKQYPTTSWVPRAVLHVDMDAFFAAIEQLDHPEWRGKPVIVGGDKNRRGVVSTCSYEARTFGVRSAMPSARAAALCPNAIWARPRFERYSEFSRRIRQIFEDETPYVQPVSVDEAFLEVTPGRFASDDPVDVAVRIQQRVAELGLSCSVGLATSKTVAKVASDFKKPNGLTIVCPGEERAFFAPLPVRALSGVGPKSAERLEAAGIRTLGDLAALDEETATALAGSQGPMLTLRARGIDEREVVVREPRKSISNERTFAEDLHDRAEIDDVMWFLSAKVCSRMRKHDVLARTVSVKVRYGDFTTRSAQRTLTSPSSDESVIREMAQQLLESLWTQGVGVRLLGVGVSGFDDCVEQLTLSGDEDGPQRDEERVIIEDIDRINERFGAGTVQRGARGKRDPHARRERTHE